MTEAEWEAECRRRLTINEGERTQMYHDSVGVPTIGIGFNLQRPDARAILGKIGADYDAVMAGTALSSQQVADLFAYSFAPIVDQARASLQPFHFDSMTDARRFVICDLVFNLGADGWNGFSDTRGAIDGACHAGRTGDTASEHALFGTAADDLTSSLWYRQVGNRAKRDVAMLRTSNWCDPNGDGSDAA
jgi:GH24 family phage-related lysozyme (muramidase)